MHSISLGDIIEIDGAHPKHNCFDRARGVIVKLEKSSVAVRILDSNSCHIGPEDFHGSRHRYFEIGTLISVHTDKISPAVDQHRSVKWQTKMRW
jgi:hypothetical protein